jgi:hypothetical protein
MMKNNIKIEVHQEDWMPGFAAYQGDSLSEESAAHVTLNIGSLLTMVKSKDLNKEDVPYFIAECLMHEIIHVLQEWAGVEFSEEKIDKLIEKYSEKYSNPPKEN